MKITYKGKHTFILPRSGGGKPLVLSPNQSGTLEEKDWDILHSKKNLKAMQKKGLLIVSGAKPETTETAEPSPLPIPTLEEIKELNPKTEEEKVIEDFQKTAWKRAAFRVRDMTDLRMIKKLYDLEERPSVKKALEDRLIELEIQEEESQKQE